ncbi:MAG TPA: LLM class F420-dependent oxidoreductase [Acidimicrobiales bacterium]|jgi:probable F420-dependent oxidoreductase
MRVGVTTIFDGRPGHRREYVEEVARTAERLGFATLWAPEHIAFFDDYSSRYPHSEDGTFGFLPDQGCLDALTVLSVAASVTSTIRLGTTVELVPMRNPLVRARELASFDVLSGGRLVYGVGVGWMREEYDAAGVPFGERGRITDEHLAAMRALWTERRASHAGPRLRFEGVICFPKPVQQPHPPILVGGITRPALRRAARLGDGWYGWKLTVEELDERLTVLDEELAAAGRSREGFRVQLGGPHAIGEVESIRRYLAALEERGVEEYTLGVSLPPDQVEERLTAWAEALGLRP